MSPGSAWITSARFNRAFLLLYEIATRTDGISLADALSVLWRRLGGPISEVAELIQLLANQGLLQQAESRLRATKAGNVLARMPEDRALREFALTLIRAGSFHDQAEGLFESGRLLPGGDLECPRKIARDVAPQLLGILQLWPEVSILGVVTIPKFLIVELTDVKSLLPPDAEIPTWLQERQRVGLRAERYSLQYQRTLVADPSRIIWVSRETDSLGWDIEDRTNYPPLLIEVKGTRDENIVFFLTSNEYTKAQQFGRRYEVQFWGAIDLKRDPASEYATLRAAGYPIKLSNLAAQLSSGAWLVEPSEWRVTRTAPKD